MSAWLVCGIAVVYFVVAVDLICKRQYAMAGVWASYATANVCWAFTLR